MIMNVEISSSDTSFKWHTMTPINKTESLLFSYFPTWAKSSESHFANSLSAWNFSHSVKTPVSRSENKQSFIFPSSPKLSPNNSLLDSSLSTIANLSTSPTGPSERPVFKSSSVWLNSVPNKKSKHFSLKLCSICLKIITNGSEHLHTKT